MPGIPADITIAGRTPATIKGNLPPLINTAEAARGWFRAGDDANPTGVLFETNFANDADYSITETGIWTETNKPAGFDSAICSGNSVAEVLAAGVDNKNVLRLKYGTNESQPEISFRKHLTKNTEMGFAELFFRFNVRFANNYKFGDGASELPYWKWFRLAQNQEPLVRQSWSENRADSYYVVGNFSVSPEYGSRPNIACAGNEEDGTVADRSAGSAGGPHALLDWYIAGNPIPHKNNTGYFERMPGWEIDWVTNPGRFQTYTDGVAQVFHTYEVRVKCASSPGADDGELEIYFDGVSQGAPRRIQDRYNPATGPFTGMPTAVNGSGFNAIHFFDNMTKFNDDFALSGVDGWMDVADLVVSTERIGHDYAAGNR